MPPQVAFTLAGMMQPIVKNGLVFVASQEGTVFAIREEDGTTAWEAPLPGGAIATGVSSTAVVAFASVTGHVRGYAFATGRVEWEVATGRSITGAPCLVDDRLVVANHGGEVCAIEVGSGRVLWKSARLGAAVQGSLAASQTAVYLGTEDLKVHKLNLADGRLEATRQVQGQSFRLLWPVIHGHRLWLRTAPVWCVGSEGVNDPLLDTASSLADEETKYLDWLGGSVAFGAWSSKDDWRSYFALSLADLEESFRIPCGPSEGCGQPPDPPAVTGNGELISWWPTRFSGLVARSPAFGTRYTLDLAGVDPDHGRRRPLADGAVMPVWPIETDNLYALSTGGRFCYWRQRFRGTYAVDLVQRRHHQVQVEVRDRDGGVWNAPVMYVDQRESVLPRTPSLPTAGRVPATVANERLYLCESYAVTAVEHAAGEGPR